MPLPCVTFQKSLPVAGLYLLSRTWSPPRIKIADAILMCGSPTKCVVLPSPPGLELFFPAPPTHAPVRCLPLQVRPAPTPPSVHTQEAGATSSGEGRHAPNTSHCHSLQPKNTWFCAARFLQLNAALDLRGATDSAAGAAALRPSTAERDAMFWDRAVYQVLATSCRSRCRCGRKKGGTTCVPKSGRGCTSEERHEAARSVEGR
eukprot:103371-Chlamydomonas_euryale.AAC.1